ncbi:MULTISPECIES: Rv3235 family protein [unclassified Micromonospora]|uniref:Rv3235 family protein n=1 Tax=unclassified Micromonospora TaxID=2617518 RepID=UPI0022B6815F|nr:MULTISPECIES: Rv3235 family protein [unclassified Micromonospora]MCZ7420770.1 Rv3235 family protein [Verrucosispora sp. WMMA2121]WBB88774.1 Rv3235 family protein [Verrucosispora sp. WMMC514]
MTDLRRPGPARPPVRLRPAPVFEPPSVDEDTAGWPRPADGQLALDLFAAGRQWPRGRGPERQQSPQGVARSGSRPVSPGVPWPAEAGRPAGPGAAWSGREPARQLPPEALTTATPGATRVAHRFVATCLEVFNGFRPPVQLRRQLDPARVAVLLPELARATARGAPARRRSARPGVRLRRLRVCEPRPTAIEAAAVLTGAGGRSWAMALRLEQRCGNWFCTDLRVL